MEIQLDCKKIVFTLLGFVLFWAVLTDAWGYSDWIFGNASHDAGKYIYGYLSRLIWAAPAVFLIIRCSSQLKIPKSELYKPPKFDKPLMVALAISLGYVIALMLINHKGFWFNTDSFLGFVIAKYIVVGFVEETVFRGWGYNSLAAIMSDKKAAVISTIFFILLHCPAYFIRLLRFGAFDFAGLTGQTSSPLIWGFVFCWLLNKSKSLWNPIFAHILYDLAYVLLVGGN